MFLISSLKQSKNSDAINEYLQIFKNIKKPNIHEYLRILRKPNIHEYLRILKPEVTNSRSMHQSKAVIMSITTRSVQ